MKYKEFNLPDELLYNKDSSWVKIDGDVATLGIIEPVAKALKEFLFVQLPDKKPIKKGDIYVSLEALKWSGHLTSPLSGEIVDVNVDLYDSPEKINGNPYNSWIVKIKLKNKEESKELFSPKDIVGWLDKTFK